MARPGGEYSTFEFTVEDAKRARIIERINPDGTISAKNSVWEQYTKDMLMWRAVARAVRFLFPECIQGCLTPDELQPPEPLREVDSKAIDSQFVEALPPAQEKKGLTYEEIVALRPEPIEAPMPEAAPRDAHLVDVVVEQVPPQLGQQPHLEESLASIQDTPSVPESELLPFEKPKKDGTYMIRFGSHMGKRLEEIPPRELKLYLLQLQKQDERVKGADTQIKELISKISAFINQETPWQRANS